MTLTEKLAYLRKKKGLTQLRLAEELDVSRQAISRWETGESLPSTENLISLAALYGVPLDYMLNGAADEPEPKAEAKPEAEAGEVNRSVQRRLKAIICVLTAAVIALSAALICMAVSRKDDEEQILSTDKMEVMRTEGIPEIEFDIEGW